jgi:hypothetical protein
MTYDSARDWRVILFPAWLIVLHTLLITLPLWWLLMQVDVNVAGWSAVSWSSDTWPMKRSMPASIYRRTTR